ncbi:DUF3558 domain-containing protein [Pseudonocardia alni]|uniref:DUF3558 domain-containing protein n=1 Tax=Pseudonocardia alni TaxID=33907 RepID=UPI00280A787A|nr:DUF3558 domain-containing protein [Pseudonocardia alni]
MVRLVVVLLLVCGVVVGCGAAEPEGPFPPRPAEIDVALFDPCRAVPEAKLAELGVSEPGEAAAARPEDDFGPGCLWSNYQDGFNYGLRVVQRSATEISRAPGMVVSSVSGFGLVHETPRPDGTLCEIFVDVADSSSLRIQVEALDRAAHPAAESCESATSIAADVLANAPRSGN